MADEPMLDEETPEEGEIVELAPDAPSTVEDTPDGGAIVRMGGEDEGETPADEGSFYDNLLITNPDMFDASYLSSLGTDLDESINLDIEARKERDKQQEEGIKRTGMGGDAPGGATFQGASKVNHPMITQACIDFEASTIREIFPPGGPVKSLIVGKETPERLQKAQRKTRHMNHQLTKQIPAFKSSLEKLLTQLPLGGVQYQRWVYDPKTRKPRPSFVPVDMLVIPAAADDFYTAERRTFIEDITEAEFQNRVDDGIYIEDSNVAKLANPPEPTLSKAATDRIEGVEADLYNKDGLRRVYEVEVYLEVEKDEFAEGRQCPYLLRMCQQSKKILGIVRNWEESDKLQQPMIWNVEWPFVPWRGAMHVGLVQMMAGLPAATTGALRALLDSAHVNNLPTALKLKGSVQGGGSVTAEATTVTELEGGPGADDIRKLVMPFPFNPPSEALFKLLGFLVDAGQGVVRTTFEDFAENQQNMPVGTTLALIEQGMKVLSAIHGRMYTSMERTLQVLHRLNRMYITDEEIIDETGELLARREDYQGPEDVVPVADPRIFSEMQRYAQAQVIVQRADLKPDLYDQRKVEIALLERLKVSDPESYLRPAPTPTQMNAVNENVAATLGRPVAAFPEQDHLAHIQVHLDYLTSPIFGSLEPIARSFLPGIVPHLIEHIVLWYAQQVYEQATEAAGTDFAALQRFQDPETRKKVDETLAVASKGVIDEAQDTFAKVPDIILKAYQTIQQWQSQMAPQDPTAQTKLATEQMRGQNQLQLESMRQQGQQQKTTVGAQQRLAEINARMVEGGKNREAAITKTQIQESGSIQRQRMADMTKLDINTADNETAMAIATADSLQGEKSDMKNGNGINPNP